MKTHEVMGLTGVLTIRPDGPVLSVNESTAIREVFREAFDQGIQRIHVDLTAVDFVDSSFVGTVVYALRSTAMKKGGKVHLFGTTAAVHRTFSLMSLTIMFPHFCLSGKESIEL